MVEGDGKEPGGWELMRALTDIREILKTVATTEVLRLYQEGNDRRHQEAEKRQAAWEAKSEAAHVDLDAKIERKVAVALTKIEALDDKLEQRAHEERKAKSARILTVAASLFAGVISIAGIIVSAVMR